MTIWLNFGFAAVLYWLGPVWEWRLAPLAVLVFFYSLAHDYHEDAADYRAALAELAALESESKLS